MALFLRDLTKSYKSQRPVHRPRVHQHFQLGNSGTVGSALKSLLFRPSRASVRKLTVSHHSHLHSDELSSIFILQWVCCNVLQLKWKMLLQIILYQMYQWFSATILKGSFLILSLFRLGLQQCVVFVVFPVHLAVGSIGSRQDLMCSLTASVGRQLRWGLQWLSAGRLDRASGKTWTDCVLKATTNIPLIFHLSIFK